MDKSKAIKEIFYELKYVADAAHHGVEENLYDFFEQGGSFKDLTVDDLLQSKKIKKFLGDFLKMCQARENPDEELLEVESDEDDEDE